MAEKDFVAEAKKSMSSLPMKPVDIDPALKRIEVPGGTIDLEIFTADKIEKVVFCTIRMNDTGVVEATAMAWPDDSHNFPILWCNMTVVPEVMNVPIFDFIPMMDIVVWPGYAEKYVECIKDLKDNALEVLGDTVIDKATNLPSLSVYTLSPHKIVAMVNDAGVDLVPQAADGYMKKYIELWQEAAPLAEGDEKQYYLRKKAASSALMKANDPGYPFMVDVFGEDMTHRVFDAIF